MDAANKGSVTNLKEIISEIREMGLKYYSFVDKIDSWGKKYEFKEIVNFLVSKRGE